MTSNSPDSVRGAGVPPAKTPDNAYQDRPTLPRKRSHTATPTPPLLELQNVSVTRNGRTALDNITLTIEKGENVAILGPNGCGKSTLVKLIDRELYPKAGQGAMRILGQDRWNVQELRGHLGIVTNDLQRDILPETTALGVVIAGFSGTLGIYYDEATEDRIQAAHRALSLAGAEPFTCRPFGELSSGEARRVLIARALAHNPDALLLDEPTTSLDLVSAHKLLETLRSLVRQGKSLLLVTHHFEEILPEIDRVILLKQGRILLDAPRQQAMTSANLSTLFDHPIELTGQGPYSARVEGKG